MVDFSHLKKLEVNEDSEAEYVFNDVVIGYDETGANQHASIWLRPMTENNRIYLNEKVRQSNERAEAIARQTRGKDADKVQQIIDRLEDDREYARKIIAKTCAIRWGSAPLDVEGKAHEFSEEVCYEFLKCVPNRAMARLIMFVENEYNFVDPVAYATGGGVVKDPNALGNS